MPDADPHSDHFPGPVQLRRVDPTCNMKRFYRITVQPDLFGGTSLIREWGRIGQRGQLMIDHHPDEEQAVNALKKLAGAKQRRGYSDA